jgi:hypothetical protein
MMTMRTIPAAIPSAPPISSRSAPDVGSLDDLYRLTGQNERAVVRNANWAYYERLLEVVGERSRIRLAFDGKDLEIMSPGPLHEDVKELSGRLVDVVAE